MLVNLVGLLGRILFTFWARVYSVGGNGRWVVGLGGFKANSLMVLG